MDFTTEPCVQRKYKTYMLGKKQMDELRIFLLSHGVSVFSPEKIYSGLYMVTLWESAYKAFATSRVLAA